MTTTIVYNACAQMERLNANLSNVTNMTLKKPMLPLSVKPWTPFVVILDPMDVVVTRDVKAKLVNMVLTVPTVSQDHLELLDNLI